MSRFSHARFRPAQICQEVWHLLQLLVADDAVSANSSIFSPSAYETAWVALVRDPAHPGRLAFPAALTWLLRHQHADGHWGPSFPYSILPSMAALLAVRRAPPSPLTGKAAFHALVYLQHALPNWSLEICDTPYIEFLLPSLARELERDGMKLPVPDLADMQAISERKMQMIPLHTLYAGPSPLLHVLEAFGPRLDFPRLRERQSPDGGYGYSPSATAAVLIHAPEWDGRAASWLGALTQRAPAGQQGGVPTSFPADVFEIAWSVFFLLEAGLDLDEIAPHAMATVCVRLNASLGTDGACFGCGEGLPPDVDDTAMVIAALRRLGESPPLDALWAFQSGDHFATFAHERTSSPSANAHVLEALAGHPEPHEQKILAALDMLMDYLCACQGCDGTWRDKWSISPYYATMCCVLALARAGQSRAYPHLHLSAHWVLETQQSDGGWGYRASSPEETAYALLMLKHLGSGPAHQEAMRRGRTYLRRHLAELGDGPCLWVDKDLYRPDAVIRAAVLAALV